MDIATQETVFALKAPAGAEQVVLLCHGNQSRFRVAMHLENGRWTARLPLPAGWCFYRFEVDGRSYRDQTSGKLKTIDGYSCSLAIIPGPLAIQGANAPIRANATLR